MTHPVAQWLEGIRCQLLPDGRYVTVIEGTGNLIQLTAHAHISSQSLHMRVRSDQIKSKEQRQIISPLLCRASISPSAAQPESAAFWPPACWSVPVPEAAPLMWGKCLSQTFYGSHPCQITLAACSECPEPPGWCSDPCWCFHQIHLKQRTVFKKDRRRRSSHLKYNKY